MKCVVLQASPRKGGNCEVLVNEITSAMENYDVVNYFLDDLNIEPCHACGGCGDGVDCVVDDDGSKILDDLLDADVVVFSSPIYYGQMTAQGKLITDRFYSVSRNPQKSFDGTKAVLVFTQGAPEGIYDQYIELTKTSPFEFYQYWRNIDDADVDKCLNMLTFIPVSEIKEMEKWPGNRINEKKEILAFELTKNVHGEEEAKKAQEAARNLFSGNGSDENMPKEEIEVGENEDKTILDILISAGLVSSKTEGRKLVEQGGISIDSVKLLNPNEVISYLTLKTGFVLRKGKKVFLKIIGKDK